MSTAAQIPSTRLAANQRYSSRRPLRLGSVLSDSGAEIVIHDISATGMLIETSQAFSAGETLTFDLPESGSTTATVAWSSGNYFGCQFEQNVSAATVSAALLRSDPLETAPTSSGPDLDMLNSMLSEMANEDLPVEDDRYSLRTRGLVLVGLSVLCWASLGGLVSLLG